MDKHLRNDVSLGHLGKATYVEELQEWRFLRTPRNGQGIAFKIANTPNILAPSKGLNPFQEPKDGNPVTRRAEQGLLRLYPELTHCLSTIKLEETTSRAITATTAQFEPNGHGCLALGNVTRMIGTRIAEQSIPVMVCQFGNSSSSLLLRPYDFSQTLPAPGTESLLDNDQSILWNVPGGPVQQVSSSETLNEQSKIFAARLSFSTTIFSPLYHRIPVPVTLNDKENYPETYLLAKIDPNPLVDISCKLTGGHPHASVTFNPWYQRQIALIDRVGNWTVWDLQRRQQRQAGWFAERGPGGSLRYLDSVENQSTVDHFDGWGAISWVGTVNQLIICDRRNVSFCRIDVRPPKQEPLDLGLGLSSEWILDILRSGKNPSYLFVLTTIRIFWLDVTPSDDLRPSQADNSQPANILVSWRHFRDPEDISLKLTSILIDDNFFIVLYSRLNLLATAFETFSSPDEPSHLVSISDATIISLPEVQDAQSTYSTRPSHNNMNFSSMIFKARDSSSSAKDDSHLEPQKIVAFIGQLADGRLVECVYSTTGHMEDIAEDSVSMLQGRMKRLFRNHTKVVTESDFIVEDGEKSILVPFGQSRHPIEHAGTLGPATPGHEAREQWLHQYSLAISSLNAKISVNPEGSGATAPFGEWLKSLPGKLASLLLAPTPCATSRLLAETVISSFSIDEIENMAHGFDQLCHILTNSGDQFLPEFHISMLPVPGAPYSEPSTIQAGRINHISLIEFYDAIISHWLAPLHNGIPNRLRAFKEKIIRSVISEICLSSIAISRHKSVAPDAEKQLDIDFPVKIESRGIIDISEKANGWSLENFQSSQLEEGSSAGNQAKSHSDSALLSLRRYTKVTSERLVSRKTLTTVSHWAHGSDPNEYDWQASITAQETLQSDNESTKRHRKRKVKRASSSAAPSQRSVSVDISIARPWGSQPETKIGLESSQVTDNGIIMTQIEHGAFARRRNPPKEKKKKRIAGF